MKINKKKIIINLIILVIIILLIVFIVLINKEHRKEIIKDSSTSSEEVFNKLTCIENKNEYGLVKKIIDTYFLERANLSEKSSKEDKSLNEEKLFEKMNKLYLSEEEITKDNISIKLRKVNRSEICITNMYMCKKNEKIVSYFVNGYVIEKNLNKLINMNIIITLDKENMTYEILPTEYVEKKEENNLKLGDVYIINTDNIEKNEYNVCSFINVTDDDLAINYLETFKNILYVDKDVAYKLLNNEYKEKRFGSVDAFKDYCKDENLLLVNLKMNQFQVVQEENYNDYVYTGDRNNYFIIRENGIGNIELFLDTYTVNSNKFIEKYNQVTDIEKVELNIQKYINAINVKDYEYAYNLLDDNFKQNYFKTLNDFKKYIIDNYYDLNKIEFKTKTLEHGTYLIGVSILNASEEHSVQNKQTTIIIKLKDNYEFKMSFKMK